MQIDPEGIEAATIMELVDLRGKSILEIGFGRGRETAFLVRPDNQILAIDPFPSDIEATRRTLPMVTFEETDFLATHFIAQFDLVVFSMSLHHIPIRERKVTAMLKAMAARKDRGEILVIEPVMEAPVTQLIAGFTDEVQELQEAASILQKTGLVYKEQRIVSTDWVFDSQGEMVQFFLGLFTAQHRVRGITASDIEAKLRELHLAEDRSVLQDRIHFYLL